MTSHRRLAFAAALLLALRGACASGKRFAYEGVGRDEWQQPEAVVALLGIGPGDRVADLGAGGGYFTFRLAEAVGRVGPRLRGGRRRRHGRATWRSRRASAAPRTSRS